jgi:hypothetical protein
MSWENDPLQHSYSHQRLHACAAIEEVSRIAPQRLSDSTSALLHQNQELREEIRQLRAAMPIWAEAAVRTCQSCVLRKAPERATGISGDEGAGDLARLAAALRSACNG